MTTSPTTDIIPTSSLISPMIIRCSVNQLGASFMFRIIWFTLYPICKGRFHTKHGIKCVFCNIFLHSIQTNICHADFSCFQKVVNTSISCMACWHRQISTNGATSMSGFMPISGRFIANKITTTTQILPVTGAG